MTDKPPTTSDATQIAGGSGVVFAGGLVDRGIRWGVKWYLSGALGPAGLGVYELASKVGSTITAFSPLGLDTGIVLFASRYRKSGEQGRLKAALLTAFCLALGCGLLAGLGLYAAARWGLWWSDRPEIARAMMWMAPIVVVWTPLLTAVGALRAVKDMKRSALAFQIVLPVVLLVTSLVAVGGLGWGVDGALAALGLATALALVAAAAFCWRHFGGLLRDRSVRPAWEVRHLLHFSIPQSMTAATFRLNLYMDVLMLGLLASEGDVGIYAIAASLASFGSIPANAVTSMFNPYIAELVYVNQLERLNGLLKTVTRWLVIVSAPVYVALFLAPDLVLSIYDEAYAAALVPLLLLAAGQGIQTACAPTMRLIPMSGHAMLNLINGIAALVLNVGLNWLLIPRYGAVGAAAATGLTLALWSLWRVGEVRWMLRCFPFGWRSTALLGVAVGGTWGAYVASEGAGVLVRVMWIAVAIAAFTGTAIGLRTPEDAALLERVRTRLRRRR